MSLPKNDVHPAFGNSATTTGSLVYIPSPTHLAEVDPSLLGRLARSKLLHSFDMLGLACSMLTK